MEIFQYSPLFGYNWILKRRDCSRSARLLHRRQVAADTLTDQVDVLMGWKDLEFTGSDSAERVRRLQALCAASPKDAGFDGLLIIGGVDSYNSTLSQAVLKYLLLGSSGQELLGEQVLSEENDRLEDVVLVITRHRISIFYSSESDAAVKILPMISQWRNVTEYVYNDSMDPDEQEARKIKAFKEMVSNVKRVGIPYGLDSEGKDLQDKMIAEKWPLVQSYGLEDGAIGKGFFTMNHQVVNVSRLLKEEMAELDDFSAKRVGTEVAPLLAHHYNQFLMKLDHADTPAVRNTKSESEVGEDLMSFYEFGTTQYEARGLVTAAHRGSRVLFGTHTSQATGTPSASALLKTSGVSADRPATHMLVQSEDPFSGVRFTRTYFLATGKLAARVIDEDALVHELTETNSKSGEDKTTTNALDIRLLIALYVALLRSFRTAVRAFVQHATTASSTPSIAQCIAQAKTAVLRELKSAVDSQTAIISQCKLPANYVEENLVIHAENLDACGRELKSLGNVWNLVYLSLEVRHVPCQSAVTESLGSVVIGDSILFRSRPPSPSTPFLNTTASFPYFRSWIQAGTEAAAMNAQLSALQSEFMLQSPALRLGRPITPLDGSFDEGYTDVVTAEPATSIAPSGAPQATSSIGLSRAQLLLECEELPLLNGSMQLFTGGFCFKTPHMIPIIVSFAKHVSSFRIVSTAYEELVLLQLELKRDEQDTVIGQVLPFAIANTRTIAFPLLAGTRFQEEIIRALGSWKSTAESLGVPFYRPHDLVQYEGSTPRDDRMVNGTDLPLVMTKSCADLVRKSSTSDDAVIDVLFPRSFIPKDTNPSTALPKLKKADRSKTLVPLTVVLGIPGSSASSIASTICEVSSAAYDWEVIEIDCRDDDNDSNHVEIVSKHLTKRVSAKLQRVLSSSSDLPPRLMLCIIGYVDAISVASSIKDASPDWPLPTKVASIIGCVSATNVYLPDPLGAQCPFPKIFDQLTSGFATHVVVTHSSDVPPSSMGRLRYHIDQVNPFADIHVLSSDVFEGSLTPLLCVDRFESAYYKNFREAHFPKWDTSASTATLGFDPALVPQSIRFEIAAGIEKGRFLQSVGKTLTPFAATTKSIDKIHPMDPQLMAKQTPAKGGIRLAQSLAAEKILAQNRQLQQDTHDNYGECWCVEGIVSFAGDPTTVYEFVSTGSFVRMRVLNQVSKPLEIKVTGRQLNAAKIGELVLGCYIKMDGAIKPLRNKVSLTLQEKREIQKQHVMDDLPEGFYYDGISYIDQFGGRHEFHPRMNEFIEEHLQTLNDATQKHNSKVEENRKSQTTLVRQIAAPSV